MYPSAIQSNRIAPVAATASAVASLFVYECNRDTPGVAMPRPEIQLVVRFGSSSPGGVDVYAFGVRQKVHRKVLRGGQRTVTARLHLGANEAVLGVSASAIAGHIVALEDLWGHAAAQRLCARLAVAPTTADAAAILERAIAERIAAADGHRHQGRLAISAATRLTDTSANVNAVASELGVSVRHFRRVFREAVGMSPKTFAKVTRFHRALHAARVEGHVGWASIAAATGYYDQAHLIAEFRALAGVTPQALLDELSATPSIG